MMRTIKQATALILLIALVTPALAVTTQKNAITKQIENITTFARLYGYVKYFYPGDEVREIEWMRFAAYGAKRVASASSPEQLQKILEEIFRPVAPALIIHKNSEKKDFSMDSITPPAGKKIDLVSWQHLGVDQGSPYSVFKSIRLNRRPEISRRLKFRTIKNFIPAAPYRGKQIKLRAAVKIGSGEGRLWLRVDQPRRQVSFFDNMFDRPIIEQGKWKYYEIIGDVSEKAERIYYGGFLIKKGHIWLDDFQIYIKHKKQTEWKKLLIDNPDFEQDKVGKMPGKWKSKNVKNYIVRVSANEAVSGKKSTEIKWVPGDLPIVQPVFEAKAAPGEHISKNIGSGLSCIMPLALYGDILHTFPRASRKDFNGLITKMYTFIPKDLSPKNVYIRLGSVVIAWNVFRHFYPYFDCIDTDWEKELPKFLAIAYKNRTEKDFLKTLKKITSAIKDGQARVTKVQAGTASYLPPICIDFVGNKVVVSDVIDRRFKNILPGDIITHMNGVSIHKTIKNKEQLISAATNGWLKHRLTWDLLKGPKHTYIKITTKRNGVATQTTFKRTLFSQDYYNVTRRKEKIMEIKEGIYYIDLDQVTTDDIEIHLADLETAKTIICDLRGSPTRNQGLLPYLLTEDGFATGWKQLPRIIYPDYQNVTYQKSGWDIRPKSTRLKAKLIYLADGSSISFAESVLNLIKHHKLGTIVGEATAGTNGEVNSFILPGDFRITWTGERVIKPGGAINHGIGVIPHITVKKTIAAIKAGRDEFLEAAVKIAKQH